MDPGLAACPTTRPTQPCPAQTGERAPLADDRAPRHPERDGAAHGRPWVPSASQQCRRRVQAGAPPCESLLIVLVRLARHVRLISGRDLIVDSAPILAWR